MDDDLQTHILKIGVIALQGGFIEHLEALQAVGAEPIEVRRPEHVTEVDGLVIPGGESTVIAKLMDRSGLRHALANNPWRNLPVYGTCAGLIVMAKALTDASLMPLDLLDIEVSRNWFGRQVRSFEALLDVGGIGDPPFRAVFIRAPVITKVGKGVDVLARLPGGAIVAVRSGPKLATAFHPELTGDPRIHQLFVEMVRDASTYRHGKRFSARKGNRHTCGKRSDGKHLYRAKSMTQSDDRLLDQG